MYKLILTFFMAVLTINLIAQPYPEVSIRDIQYQDPATLINYFDDDLGSSLAGDTVTITGMVMVPPYKGADPDSGVLMYCGGGNAGFYIQDTSETDWSGLLLIQSSPISPEFAILDSGTVIKVTGYVEEYQTTTQKTTEFFVLGFDASNIVGTQPRPEPVELTLDSLKEIGTDINKAISEKWEGVYVIIRNVTTFDRNSSGGFKIFDSNNTQLNIGTKSNYFYGTPAPNDGTVLEYIKGYIETRSPSSNGITLNPGYRDDMKIQSFPPVITGVVRDPGIVGYGNAVTVTAQISDQDGTVASASLFYRKNMGANIELAMTNTGGTNYQAVIPAQGDSCTMDYFIKAVDNDNNIAITPSDTVRNRYYYFVLDRPLTIQDVQYNPYGGVYTAYHGYEVTIRGIVTADTTDLKGTETGTSLGPMLLMQNGTGPWSGIKFNGALVNDLYRGYDITVTGTIGEDFGMTQIYGIDDPGQLVINSMGNPLPTPQVLMTSDIATLSNGTTQAEQWEGVLLKYENLTVTDENADGGIGPHDPPNNYNYGDIFVADGSNTNTRIGLEFGSHSYHNFWFFGQDTIPNYVRQGDTFQSVTGVLWYGFSNYKLLPRKDDDFVGWVTDVAEVKPLPEQFELLQNYPNPFNPSTKIEFNLPTEANVSLKIYNLLGEEVQTLINNETKNAGRYTVTFEAGNLATGIYIYRLQAGDFTNNKKMILLK